MSGERGNLDLLLNVPLTISAQLGCRTLSVQELLALGPGSVVELDRAAGAPVDLLVNDRLVGRGEIVAVEERYGVRLTELLEGP